MELVGQIQCDGDWDGEGWGGKGWCKSSGVGTGGGNLVG